MIRYPVGHARGGAEQLEPPPYCSEGWFMESRTALEGASWCSTQQCMNARAASL